MEMPKSRIPRRRGVVKNFTLDRDAVTLLRQLVPSAKGLGHFMSELIRSEVDRRLAREGWAATAQAGREQ